MEELLNETISVDLAWKLEEKGMKVDVVDDSVEEWPYCYDYHCETPFDHVFDWLKKKGVNIRIEKDRNAKAESSYDFFVEKDGMEPIHVDLQDWYEAATKAIEMALELI